jgi:enamine deaminase RidA (YjgF/YER057c/UK114 family)
MIIQDVIAALSAAQSVERKAISNAKVLNEATAYGSAFSRGLRLEFGNFVVLLISGTASIDEHGMTVHKGDFRAQQRRTYANITGLLEAEGATWQDVVRTTCYLRDIERDYEAFNEERNRFFAEQGVKPFPASTGIQAILCRSDLLIEIEAIAVFKKAAAQSEGNKES